MFLALAVHNLLLTHEFTDRTVTTSANGDVADVWCVGRKDADEEPQQIGRRPRAATSPQTHPCHRAGETGNRMHLQHPERLLTALALRWVLASQSLGVAAERKDSAHTG